MTDSEIITLVSQFKEQRTPEHRYASFDYCFNYFHGFKAGRLQELAAKENLEKSCLHLGFFLASWGMLRMSGKLGQQLNLRHFGRVITEISSWDSQHDLGAVWGMDADNYGATEKRRLLRRCYSKIRELALPDGQAKDIVLVTKIMLGVFGCIPAFDGLFTGAFRNIYGAQKGCAFRSFNDPALEALGHFYEEHRGVIDRLAKETRFFDYATGKETDTCYTKAKIIDMIGFQAGQNQRSAGKR